MKRITHCLVLLLVSWGMGGCYALQDSYDYHPQNASPYLYKNTWEFIESRQDLFSQLKESIEYVDEEFPGFKDYYTQTGEDYTYLLITDDAYPGTYGLLSVVSGGTTATQVRDLDAAALRDALLYMIVEGRYHGIDRSGSLGVTPVNVIPVLKGQNSVMTMQLSENRGRDNYQRLLVNENNGSSLRGKALTSNLFATNGIVHIFDTFLYYLP